MTQKRPRPEPDPRQRALALLARREHSRLELQRKLKAAGFAEQVLVPVLDRLEGERLLSDERFAWSYVRARAGRGYGPLRIEAELRERGVEEIFINSALDEYCDTWDEIASRHYRKRFGASRARDYRERARRMRHLQQRGFPADLVHRVVVRSDASGTQ